MRLSVALAALALLLAPAAAADDPPEQDEGQGQPDQAQQPNGQANAGSDPCDPEDIHGTNAPGWAMSCVRRIVD